MSKFPESVPVFTARDMCAEAYAGPNNRHCALGWRHVLDIPGQAFFEAYHKANNCLDTATHNDHGCRTNTERAEALNAAMRELGYTEIEDA